MNINPTSILSLIVALVLFSSCGDNKNNRTLQTANNEIIALQADEKPLDLNKADKFTVKRYEHYFNALPANQIPLNKIFQSRTCQYYYGIPLDGDVASLYNAFQEKYANNTILKNINQNATEAQIFAKDSVNFILITVFKTEANNYLLGGAISKDSALLMHNFETSNLRTRISK
jgi:hypothetical protein